MRILFLSPSDTITLCRGLKDGQAGGKLCHVKAYTALKYPKVITVFLLPLNEYLMLPGYHTVNPFSLFRYEGFPERTIQNM